MAISFTSEVDSWASKIATYCAPRRMSKCVDLIEFTPLPCGTYAHTKLYEDSVSFYMIFVADKVIPWSVYKELSPKESRSFSCYIQDMNYRDTVLAIRNNSGSN